MLNAIKEAQGKALVIRLSGVVDETVNLDQLLGPVSQPEVHLYLREITRLNSMGVKLWIRYFHGLATQGKVIRVFEASPVVVGQLNLMLNFIPGAIYESVCAPYLCSNCKTQFQAVYRTEALKGVMHQMPPQKCPKCGGTAQFDDIEAEYFSFLTRRT